MKKYKDGKVYDVTLEEAEKYRKRFEKYGFTRRNLTSEYEERIKNLEEKLSTALEQLNQLKEESNDNT